MHSGLLPIFQSEDRFSKEMKRLGLELLDLSLEIAQVSGNICRLLLFGNQEKVILAGRGFCRIQCHTQETSNSILAKNMLGT